MQNGCSLLAIVETIARQTSGVLCFPTLSHGLSLKSAIDQVVAALTLAPAHVQIRPVDRPEIEALAEKQSVAIGRVRII